LLAVFILASAAAAVAHDCSGPDDCATIPPNVDIATGIGAGGAGAALGWYLFNKKRREEECERLRRQCAASRKAADEAEQAAKEARKKADEANQPCAEARKARAAAEKVLADLDDAYLDNSWAESEGRRITRRDLRLKRDAAKTAWQKYRGGAISAQQLEQEWQRLETPEALDELRKNDHQNRGTQKADAEQKLAAAKQQEADACANADEQLEAAAKEAESKAGAARKKADADCKAAAACGPAKESPEPVKPKAEKDDDEPKPAPPPPTPPVVPVEPPKPKPCSELVAEYWRKSDAVYSAQKAYSAANLKAMDQHNRYFAREYATPETCRKYAEEYLAEAEKWDRNAESFAQDGQQERMNNYRGMARLSRERAQFYFSLADQDPAMLRTEAELAKRQADALLDALRASANELEAARQAWVDCASAYPDMPIEERPAEYYDYVGQVTGEMDPGTGTGSPDGGADDSQDDPTPTIFNKRRGDQ
jgi:hypothetical protein